MASRTARLLKQVKLEVDGKAKWMKCPVATTSKGKYKLGHVIVANAEEVHPEGTFYLDYRVDGTRKCLTVQAILSAAGYTGITAANLTDTEVRSAIRIVEQHLEGLKSCTPADVAWAAEQVKGLGGTAVVEDNSTITNNIKAYLTAVEVGGSRPHTIEAYETSLRNFRQYLGGMAPDQKLPLNFTKKTLVREITKDDLKGFYEYMATLAPNRKSPTGVGLSATTRNGKYGEVQTWLGYAGRSDLLILGAGERPMKKAKKEKPDTTPYTPEALQRLNTNCESVDERELYEFARAEGMRPGEIAHAHFTDLIPSVSGLGGFVRIETKIEDDWKPKTANSFREVPVPTSVWNMLMERKKRTGSGLIFPTDCKRRTNAFLRRLKKTGKRARLDCAGLGRNPCAGCAAGKNCRHIYMHKFRHTFACEQLWANTDIKTVATWMGDTVETVLEKYVKGLPAEEGLVKRIANAAVTVPQVPVDALALLSTPEGLAQFQQFMAAKGAKA
jgi:integrase